MTPRGAQTPSSAFLSRLMWRASSRRHGSVLPRPLVSVFLTPRLPPSSCATTNTTALKVLPLLWKKNLVAMLSLKCVANGCGIFARRRARRVTFTSRLLGQNEKGFSVRNEQEQESSQPVEPRVLSPPLHPFPRYPPPYFNRAVEAAVACM